MIQAPSLARPANTSSDLQNPVLDVNWVSLQIPYTDPVPETLHRVISEHRLKVVRELEDDSFW